MEPSPRGDWYSTCFDLSRDPGMPISAPGSPLLPGCRVATACSSLDRIKSHTVGRTEGRKLAGQPKLGDGIRYRSNSLIISLTLSRKYTFVSLRWLLLLRSFVAVQLFCLKVKRYCILLTKKNRKWMRKLQSWIIEPIFKDNAALSHSPWIPFRIYPFPVDRFKILMNIPSMI